MKNIVVGKIVKPQGIRGEVKVVPFVDAPEGFCRLKSVAIGGSVYRILRARVVGNEVYLSLDGVVDRNQAELLRECELTVPRSVADVLKHGEFFVSDLIGLSVVKEKEELGKIREILQYGAADVLVIEGKKHYMAPYLKRLVSKVDLTEGVMLVDAGVWSEVSCEN